VKKVCIRCGVEKDTDNSDFSFIKKTQKYDNTCRQCNREYQENYREENKQVLLSDKKLYYQNNRVSIRAKQKLYRQQNLDAYKIRDKKYYENNKDTIIFKKRAYKKKRRETDPVFNLRNTISRAITLMISSQGAIKHRKSCLKHLPYTIQELKDHLEKQFEPWMNWDNHGVYVSNQWDNNDSSTWFWQLDHIVPQSDLSYSSMEDDNFKKCWALENLRPLSAKQNHLDGVNRTRHK
jgi:hypothetical protein